jgi:hypothetical protein
MWHDSSYRCPYVTENTHDDVIMPLEEGKKRFSEVLAEGKSLSDRKRSRRIIQHATILFKLPPSSKAKDGEMNRTNH